MPLIYHRPMLEDSVGDDTRCASIVLSPIDRVLRHYTVAKKELSSSRLPSRMFTTVSPVEVPRRSRVIESFLDVREALRAHPSVSISITSVDGGRRAGVYKPSPTVQFERRLMCPRHADVVSRLGLSRRHYSPPRFNLL